ncbi:MAG TPA: DUF4190 domain-containing protein [Cellulomonas sp.]
MSTHVTPPPDDAHPADVPYPLGGPYPPSGTAWQPGAAPVHGATADPASYPQPYPQPYPVMMVPMVPAQRSTGIAVAGLVTAIIPCTALIGLVLSIVALVQSRRDGRGRAMSIAGTAVAAVWVVGYALLTIFGLITQSRICDKYGPGTHTVDGTVYSCHY